MCLQSMLSFGISNLFLIYVMIPVLKKFVIKISKKTVGVISIILALTFVLDMILYAIIH